MNSKALEMRSYWHFTFLDTSSLGEFWGIPSFSQPVVTAEHLVYQAACWMPGTRHSKQDAVLASWGPAT